MDDFSEIRTELNTLAPYEEHEAVDWEDVLRRSFPASTWPGRVSETHVRHMRRRVALAVAAVTLLAALPSLALSSDVRRVIGLQDPPEPVVAEARLLVEAPIDDRRMARVYEAPSSTGGHCWFTAYLPAGSTARPETPDGGVSCTAGPDPESSGPPILWSLSIQPKPPSTNASWTPPVIDGWINPNLHATKVVLEWSTGSRAFVFANDHFVLVEARLAQPPAESPYSIVAYDAEGDEVAHATIRRVLESPG
jgi:hypothetical protein